MGWTTGARFPAGEGNLFPRYRVQTGSRTHPASYLGVPGNTSHRCKATEAWSWQLTSM